MTKGPYGIPQNVQRTVIALLTANTADLRELAQIAGRDPATFYRGANLRSCDLSTSNLDGIDLTGADKSRAKLPNAYGRKQSHVRSDTRLSGPMDVEAVIEDFRRHMPAEEVERLELAYIADLVDKSEWKSLELATTRFLALAESIGFSGRSKFRAVWAKLAITSVTPALLKKGSSGPDERLFEGGLLSRIGVDVSLVEAMIKLRPKDGSLLLSLDRIVIIGALLEAANLTVDTAILLEIAVAFSKHDFLDHSTWEKALASARYYAEAASVLGKMRSLGIPIDLKSWNYILGSKPSYKVGRQLLEEMIVAGITPDVVSWNTVLSLAPDYLTGRAVLEEVIAAGITPDVVSWNTLLSLAPDYLTGRAVLEEVIAAGITTNVVTWNTLLKLAPDYLTGRAVLEEQIAVGITTNVGTWNTLLNLAPDYLTGRTVLEEMITAAIKSSAVTWNTLIKLAPDYPTGRAVLEEMFAARIKSNIVIWNTLLNLAPDYSTGRAVLEEMILVGIAPTEATATALAKRITSTNQATALTRLLAPYKVVGSGYFGAVFSRIAAGLSANELLDWAFSIVAEFDMRPPDASFDAPLAYFRRKRRFDDALRIALPFPHLDSAQALLRKSKVQERAEAYFKSEYSNGSEPHNAAKALAHLYCITGDTAKLNEWVGIAKSYPNQHPKRIETLDRLLISAKRDAES